VAENVDTLKKGFDAFNEGDIDTVKETFHEDVTWQGPNTQEVPGGGKTEGLEDVLKMFGEIQEEWENFQATPDEFIDAGDTVIVLGHVTGKHQESGNELKTPFVHVWRMDDGKAKRVQALLDTAEVLEAMKGSGGDGGGEKKKDDDDDDDKKKDDDKGSAEKKDDDSGSDDNGGDDDDKNGDDDS
jgi:ketosteroid isomerase-like protein